MKRSVKTCLFGLGATLALTFAPVPARAASKNFIALLNGGQETPPTTSDALGVGFFTFDTKTNQLCYRISFTSLQGGRPDTAAHIHGPAAPGVSAAILVTIPETGQAKNNCVTPDATTLKTLKKALLKGMTYANIHSANFPGGEIRGQILPMK
ncbi:MAG: CHRD domain-containing protein [Deltaproteobacteria bacterium]|nr:MAG: CHRD domain-containing protein [Deltaproteobacteria bacterium]